MRSILKSTAVLSSGWLVSLGLGLLAAKATALLIGPTGIGFLGLLQSTLGLATLVAMTAGLGSAVVRAVSGTRSVRDDADEAALRAAAWWLCALLAAITAIVMLVFREPIARLMLGRSGRAFAIVPLALAVVLTTVSNVQSALLSAHRRVTELAKIGVWNSVLGPILMIALVWTWRERALPWAVLGGAIVSLLVSRRYLQITAPAPNLSAPPGRTMRSIRTLLRLAVPLNAISMVGTTVQLTLPFLVLHHLGNGAVGFYRAASGISQMYLGFVAPAMGQDFYPRAAACAGDGAALNQVTNDQIRAMLVIAGPVILGALTLIPYVLPQVYTAEFQPAVVILEWQMTGDVLKVAASAMGFAILARSGGTPLVYSDLSAGVSLLVLTLAGLRVMGLEGIGVAFFLTSGIGSVMYWTILRRTTDFRLTPRNRGLFGGLFCSALIIHALSLGHFDRVRLVVGLIFTAAAAWTSWRTVRAELDGRLRAAMPLSNTTTL